MVEVKGDLGRVGGGIPVVAFWTKTVGEAIGHVETLPLVLAIPVKTESDGHVDASVQLTPESALQPGEAYSTPETFHRGVFGRLLRAAANLFRRD